MTLLVGAHVLVAAEKSVSAKVNHIALPDYFKTLVNPQCSYCNDEAARRSKELRDSDRVLAWIRGVHEGGAVPFRFFLVPYRVISDSYGVWVYDVDAGFIRGFEPSYNFTFHGWRNGVMAIQDQDGTVFSALSGVAFDGPRKGTALEPVPVIETDWGYWLKAYPRTVAYRMFDKFTPFEAPSVKNPNSLATRPPPDPRLPEDERVIGIALGTAAKAYPLSLLATNQLIHDRIGDQEIVVLWYAPTRTAAIYAPRMETNQIPARLTLQADAQIPTAPFMDHETYSHWSIEGRAMEGPLKGNTLVWLPGVPCRWFAWAAEYPGTKIYSPSEKRAEIPAAPVTARLIHGERLDWDRLVKTGARIASIDTGAVTVVADTDREEHRITFTPHTEFYYHGAWAGAGDFTAAQRVFVIATTDEKGKWSTAHALADEISMQAMSEPPTLKQSDGRFLLFAHGRERKASVKLMYDRRMRISTSNAVPLAVGQMYFFNSRQQGDERSAAEVFDARSLAAERGLREKQNLELAAKLGLLATVAELDETRHRVHLLVRRADAWFARSLAANDKVLLRSVGRDQPEEFAVLEARPDYTRERVALSVAPARVKTFQPGERVHLVFPLPGGLDAETPPDLGRFTVRQERLDYFLSTIYCSCGMLGTSCAGHWNTLAACQLHGCGMPSVMTQLIGDWVDAGRSDQEILTALVQRDGKKILRQHHQP